jgi:hypothetical protein
LAELPDVLCGNGIGYRSEVLRPAGDGSIIHVGECEGLAWPGVNLLKWDVVRFHPCSDAVCVGASGEDDDFREFLQRSRKLKRARDRIADGVFSCPAIAARENAVEIDSHAWFLRAFGLEPFA